MNSEEIERRKPVWLIISEFYLDTDFEVDDLPRFIDVFKKSNYSLQELKDIDFYEVKPIVGSNLSSVAGAWSGFDEEWLYEEIKKNTLDNRKNNLWISFKRFRFDSSKFNYWNRFKSEFKILE